MQLKSQVLSKDSATSISSLIHLGVTFHRRGEVKQARTLYESALQRSAKCRLAGTANFSYRLNKILQGRYFCATWPWKSGIHKRLCIIKRAAHWPR